MSARHCHLVTPGGRAHTTADSIYVIKEPEAKQPAVSARHGHLVTQGGRAHTMADSIYKTKQPEAKEPAVCQTWPPSNTRRQVTHYGG